MPHATNILHKQLLHTYTFMQGQFLDVMLGPAVTSHRLISCYDTFSLFLSASFLTSCWTGSLPSATRSTYMPLICRDTSLTSCWAGSLPSATRSSYMPLICRDTSLTSCWAGSPSSATRSSYMPLICRDTSNIMPGRQSSLNYLLFLHATDL